MRLIWIGIKTLLTARQQGSKLPIGNTENRITVKILNFSANYRSTNHVTR
jgi:hypothetical protein